MENATMKAAPGKRNAISNLGSTVLAKYAEWSTGGTCDESDALSTYDMLAQWERTARCSELALDLGEF